MPEYPKEIEIERVVNLVRGFGWEMIKQEIIGEDLQITLKKKFLAPAEVPGVTPAT